MPTACDAATTNQPGVRRVDWPHAAHSASATQDANTRTGP